MLKKIALLALIAVTMLALTGCVDYSSMVSSYVSGSDSEEAEADPTPIPPLTAAKFTDADAFLKAYNDVKFSDTKDSITERYGEPVSGQLSEGDYYSWVLNDGTGFAAVFFDNGRLRAKVVHYDDIRQLTQIAYGKNLSLASNLSDDVSYKTVCGLFDGKGLEISRIASNSSAAPDYTRVVLWLDGEGNAVQILFTADDKVSKVSSGSVGTDAGDPVEEVLEETPAP